MFKLINFNIKIILSVDTAVYIYKNHFIIIKGDKIKLLSN